jgi:putative SOS response-associated peptidase YedK
MCYSNSSTSTNVQLAERYKREIPANCPEEPIYCASGFSFPLWRVITLKPTIELMNWGLIPRWYNGDNPSTIASKTLNAKIESLHERNSFRHLVDQHRCIIPSSGFFEWQHVNSQKIPHFIFPSNSPVFSMAGLLDKWVDSKGITHSTFTIVTCPANELMRKIHNTKQRMPLLLLPEQEDEWLQSSLKHAEILSPFPVNLMSSVEINRAVILGKKTNVKEVQAPFTNHITVQGSLF